jgi:anhydro-N-acetylmuramic acid kinase
MNILGLMSGTSLDGIDAAVVDIRPRGAGYALACQRFMTVPFADDMRDRLLAALPPHAPPVHEVAALDDAFGSELARAALLACEGVRVDAIGSHGITLYHRGEAGISLQIGAPYRLRDALQATVVYDFRRADCARGGHGAPLVPHFDALAFGSDTRDIVALNLGGIANVSIVPRASRAVARAWDTGPANVLIDTFVSARTGGREHYDRGGHYANAGRVDAALLASLLDSARTYLDAEPPKSTGRERFGPQFLAAHDAAIAGLSLEDGCATLAAFTVTTLATSLERFGPPAADLIVSGGGARNAAIVNGLFKRLEPGGWRIVSSKTRGVDPDAKEAMAFALFAYETLRGRPASVAAATGASVSSVLGSIVPFELEALLTKIRAELATNAAE